MPSQDPIPLSSLLDHNYTFEQLAAAHNTTIEAITTWMSTPDVQERLNTIEAASIQRTRIITHRYLPAVAIACHAIVHKFNNPEALAAIDPTDHAAMDHERRNAETARRAGRLLLQLARFRKVASAAPASAPSSPLGRGAEALRGGEGSPSSLPAFPTSSSSSASPPDQPVSSPSSSTSPDIFALLQTPEFQSALATALNSPPAPPLVEPKNPPAHADDPTFHAPSPLSNLKFEISNPSPSPARDSRHNTLSPGHQTREEARESTKPAERATHAHHPGEAIAHEHPTLPHARAP